MPKYSVLFHETPNQQARQNHFDLMLENDGVLATWEIKFWPPGDSQLARALADHRVMYLDYEGPLTGNRGSVSKFCQGTASIRYRDLRRWEVELAGSKFSGVIELVKKDQADEHHLWLLSVLAATSEIP